MKHDIAIKMCGLTRPEDVVAAADAGAQYVGFVFFRHSPRHLDVAALAALALATPEGITRVALTADAGDAELDALTSAAPLDMLQLHGNESATRVAEIKARYGLPVMKAIGIAEGSDLALIDVYAGVADRLLIDAKPPRGAVLPGGNGLAFDWTLISKRRWLLPWMLAGGLTPENAAEAVRCTGARQLDMSSGIESAPGIKDAGLMRAFVAAAQG